MATNFDHECKHGEELALMSQKIDRVIERLGNGDVTLATLKLSLDGVEKQTKKTNGRVTALEGWRRWVIGVCCGIGIVNAPIFLYVLGKLLKAL